MGTMDLAYPFFNTDFIGVQSPTIEWLTPGRKPNPLADAVTSCLQPIFDAFSSVFESEGFNVGHQPDSCKLFVFRAGTMQRQQ
ncbi:hypothetical protein M3A49_39165 [Paraburkholderia sp. CNPSo 3076]|nr:hypothetical protein [Paraburkholderia sp. CNPSo 3076]